MTLTLELPPELENALAEDARRKGTTPEGMILEELRERYVPTKEAGPTTGKYEDPTLALFAQWDAEDTTDDPEEISRRNQEWAETKANLAANRVNFAGRTDFSFLLNEQEDNLQERAA